MVEGKKKKGKKKKSKREHGETTPTPTRKTSNYEDARNKQQQKVSP
jgi:hypothetical protein